MSKRIAASIVSTIILAGCSFLLNDKFAGDEPATTPNEAGTSGDSAAGVDTGDGDARVEDAGSDAIADAAADALDPSLVALFTFDDAPGAVISDKTGHGHVFEPHTTAVKPGAGIRGGALECFGSSTAGRVTSLDAASFPDNGTLSFWMKPTFDAGTGPADRSPFDGWDSTRAHLFVRHVAGDPVESFQAALQPAIANYSWAKGFNVLTGNWAHVVLVWDSKSMSAILIVDQQLLKNEAYQGTTNFLPANQRFAVGEGFIGLIDEVALYDRAMSLSEALLLP